MKNHLIAVSIITGLFLFGCQEKPTPTEVIINQTEQTTNNQLHKESIIITEPPPTTPFDWQNNGGHTISSEEASLLTRNYTYRINKVQKIFVSKTLLETALADIGAYGVIFYLGQTSTGKFTVVSVPADMYGKKITSSRAIGCETEFISYAKAQLLTNNFSYKIGNIKGRMASKGFIQTMLGDKGIDLNCALNAAGEFTFVVTSVAIQSATAPPPGDALPPLE